MLEFIIIVSDTDIIIQPLDNALQVVTNEVTVTPVFEENASSLNISLNPTEIAIQPTIFEPYITDSFGIKDLYILVVDMELIEEWHNQIAAIQSSVNWLLAQCTICQNLIDGLQTQVDGIELSIQNIQTTVATFQPQIDDLYLKYNALETTIGEYGLKFISIESDILYMEQLILTLEAQYESLDGRIVANASLIESNTVRIDINADEISIAANQILNMGVSLADHNQRIMANGNLLQVHEVKIISNQSLLQSQGSAITAINVDLSDLNDEIIVNANAVSSLFASVQLHDGEISAIAAQTTELRAEIPASFYPFLAWEFDVDLEGWYATESATVNQTEDNAILIGNGHFQIDFASPVNGSIYYWISILWQTQVLIGLWVGEVYYKYEGGPSEYTLVGTLDYIYGDDDYNHSMVNCKTEWAGKQITSIAIKFANGGTFAIDSVGVGRTSGSGSMAFIRRESVAWVTESEAFTQITDEIYAAIGDVEGSITTDAQIKALADGQIALTWKLEFNGDGRITGMYVAATEERTDWKIVADNFYMNTPSTGDVRIFDAGLDINGNPVVKMINVAIQQTIYSSNYISEPGIQHTGWMINEDGTAEFSGIAIYNSSGNLVLSSGSGINVSEFDDEIANLLSNGTGGVAGFGDDLYADIQDAIDAGTATYVDTLITRNAWIKTAYIDELTVGTANLSQNAITDFTYSSIGTYTITELAPPGFYTIFDLTIDVPSIKQTNGAYIAPHLKHEIILSIKDTQCFECMVLLLEIWIGEPGVAGSRKLDWWQIDCTTVGYFKQTFSIFDTPIKGLLPGSHHMYVVVNKRDIGNMANLDLTYGEWTTQSFKK